ncbi:transposase [Nocardia gamkensis]|uniref:transposase n=1 Tax=Nocardia gamkensis TaxID=352869 RepID=UPI0036E49897
MSGRKRHSAEDIVRKLRRADELAPAAATGEEIAKDLGGSAATLCNWRREYGTAGQRPPPAQTVWISSIPPIEADMPKVGWALDFQFDSTTDGRAVKIASMLDEHTRE